MTGIAIKALRKPQAASHPLIQLAPKDQATRLKHVEAHPELVKAAADYTLKDKDIFLADMIAGGDLGKGEIYFDESNSIIVSDIQILHDLSREVDVPFVSTLEGHLNLEPLLQRYQRLAHAEYLRKRDEYKHQQASAAASLSPTWQGTSFAVTHNLFKKVTTGARRSQCQRIIYDWHYTGRNKFKATGSTDDLKCVSARRSATHIVSL